MQGASLKIDIEFDFDGKRYQFKAGDFIQVRREGDDIEAFDEVTGIHFDIFNDEFNFNN